MKVLERIAKHFAARIADELQLRPVQVLSVRLQPGDVIVLHVKEHLSAEACERLTQTARRQFWGHRVVVLDGGMEIKIVS